MSDSAWHRGSDERPGLGGHSRNSIRKTQIRGSSRVLAHGFRLPVPSQLIDGISGFGGERHGIYKKRGSDQISGSAFFSYSAAANVARK